MSDYKWQVILIALDKQMGNQLAHLVASFPGDPNAEINTFTDGGLLSPTAYYSLTLAKDTFAGVCEAISADADYADPLLFYLREKITEEQWALAKSIIRCEVIPRDQFTRQHLLDFIQAQGFEIMEPSE